MTVKLPRSLPRSQSSTICRSGIDVPYRASSTNPTLPSPGLSIPESLTAAEASAELFEKATAVLIKAAEEAADSSERAQDLGFEKRQFAA